MFSNLPISRGGGRGLIFKLVLLQKIIVVTTESLRKNLESKSNQDSEKDSISQVCRNRKIVFRSREKCVNPLKILFGNLKCVVNLQRFEESMRDIVAGTGIGAS